MKISEAAELLGWTPNMLRMAIRLGKVDFGIAVKTDDKRRYRYLIYEDRLKKYCNFSRK